MKKALKEILLIIGVIILLNVTGLLGEVTGFIQRGVMFTGLLNADIETPEEQNAADYQFILTDFDGNKKLLKDYEGKVVFLNLWASWCGPCIAEMPGIQNLYDDIQNDSIVFIMVSLDESAEKAKKFIERKEYTFPVFMAENGVPDIYHVGSIPATYVISPDGKIVFSKKGTANYDTNQFKKFLRSQAGS